MVKINNIADLKNVGKYGTYDLYQFEGHYYATNVDCDTATMLELIKDKKLIQAENEEALKDIIESSNSWADTRGMYALEKNSGSSAIRANSFNFDENDDNPLEQPAIFVNDGEFFLLEEADKTEIENDALKLLISFSVSATPELISSYKGYNLVEFDKTFFGIEQALGPIDLTEVSPSEVEGVLYGDMVKSVMDQIDLKVSDISQASEPQLLESYHGYNIIQYGKKVYGIAQSLGPIDLAKTVLSKITGIMSGETKENVMEQIDLKISGVSKAYRQKVTQEFVEDCGDFKIVTFEKTYFGIHKSLGEYELSTEDYFSEDKVFYDTSLFGLREVLSSIK